MVLDQGEIAPLSEKVSKKRILHVALSMDIGGLQSIIISLCRHLDQSRFETEILCLRDYDPENIGELRNGGIRAHLIRKSSKYDLTFFFRVARFIRQEKIDILHAHSGCFFYAALFARMSGVRRFIYTAHGLPVLNRLQDIIEDNAAAMACSRIIPVSEEIMSVLRRRMPLARKKIKLILNGIDTARFQPFPDPEQKRLISGCYKIPSKAFVIGTLGRLDPVKNYPMLIRAFASFWKLSDKETHLVFVGEGSSKSELHSLSEEYGVRDHVTFLGPQYRVHGIVPCFDVFALSSLTEGTSIALLEAQACGVPAVVTNVGGNAAIIRNCENGFLCEVGDDRAMAGYFSQLSEDKQMLKRMGLAAAETARDRFSINSMVAEYAKIYSL
jgi:glycosyltransferase involved in cell wall biosynthesis